MKLLKNIIIFNKNKYCINLCMRLFLAIEKMFVIIGRIGGIAQLVRAAES